MDRKIASIARIILSLVLLSACGKNTSTPVPTSTTSATLQVGPVFLFPFEGADIICNASGCKCSTPDAATGMTDCGNFAVQPVENAEGYAWVILQAGEVKSDYFGDTGLLSKAEMAIGSLPWAQHFEPGEPMQVQVRARVDGQWTKTSSITFHLFRTEEERIAWYGISPTETPTQLPGPTAPPTPTPLPTAALAHEPGAYVLGVGAAGDILWMITPERVIRWNIRTGESSLFDQSELQQTVLPPAYIWRFPIVTGADGRTWFEALNGLASYDGANWKFYSEQKPFPVMELHDIAIDRAGVIWMATNQGAYSWDGTNFGSYGKPDGLVDNMVWDVLIDRAGNKWFSTPLGVSRFDGSRWTTWTSTPEDPILADGNVWTLGMDSKGNILAVTDFWVAKFDGSTWTRAFGKGWNVWCHVNYYNYSVVFDRTGAMWVGTDRNGVMVYDGTYVTQYTTQNGLIGNSINYITIDSAGNVWVATEHGLSKFDGKGWTSYYQNPDTLELHTEQIPAAAPAVKRDTTGDTQCLDRLSQLEPGMDAIVVTDAALEVKSEPSSGQNYIGELATGTVVKVLSGPVFVEGMPWWKVQSSVIPGDLGWTPEFDPWGTTYFLKPYVPICGEGWTRLQAGGSAIVSPGEPNRVRSEPKKGDNLIGTLNAGTVVKVLEGPVCADGLVYWKVESDAIPGGSGWTAEGDGKEYWMEPYQP